MTTPLREYDEEYEEEELEPETAPEATPAPPPEPVALPEPVEPPPRPAFHWIGDASRPEAQEKDGVSDLFAPETDPDTDDVVNVSVDEDVIDADIPENPLGDLLDTTEDDILGDEETGQIPLNTDARSRRQREMAKRLRQRRPPSSPDASVSGLR